MSPSRHRLIPVDARDEWSAVLERVPHAFAHTWDNCHAMSLSTGRRTFLYVWEGGAGAVVCPFEVREYHGRNDLVTPYGFSGFVGTGPVEAFPGDWRRFAGESGYVCAFVQLNPLLQDGLLFDAAERHIQGVVYAVDLRAPRDELLRRLSRNRRREIAHAEGAGVEILIDDDRAKSFFVEHYLSCMRARLANPVYLFSPETLHALVNSARTFVVGASVRGVVEAVTLYGWTPHAGDSLFNVTVGDGKRHSALLTWEGMKRLHDLEVALLNLGGGVQQDDGVAQFKERFGATRESLHCLKQVFDAKVYDDLCHLAGTDANPGTGFFPSYHSVGHTPASE